MSTLIDVTSRLTRQPGAEGDAVFRAEAAVPHDLAGLFRQEGTARTVDGSQPFLLDRPDRAVYVAAGEGDLFLVEIADGVPTGTRHYFCSFEAGDLLLGIDASDALVPVGLLAVGTVGTRIAEMPAERLRARAASAPPGDAFAASLAEAVDRWITAISGGVSRPIVPKPRPDVVFAPGERHRLRRNERAGVLHGVGWLTVGDMAPLFLDDQDLGGVAGAPIPLSGATWVSVGKNGRPLCESTAAVLADGRAWPGLTAFHAAVIETAPLTLRLAAVDEANRLRARVEADERAIGHAYAELGAVVSPRQRPEVTARLDDALFRAVAAVLETMGVKLRAPRQTSDAENAPSLDEIIGVNRLRKRQLVLETGWWRHDVGSFLLLRDGEETPQAVLRRAGGYVVHDPATGERRPLAAAEADALSGTAYMFYEPLPDVPLTGRHLFQRALRYGRLDLATVIGFGILGGLLAMAVPVATGYMVDSVIPSSDRVGLIEMGVVLLIVCLLQLLVTVTIQRATLRLEGVSGARLQAAVMDRLIRLPPRFFRDFTAGDLGVRALAIRRVEDMLTGTLINSLMSGVFALTSFGLMFYYSVQLGWIALAIGAVFVVANLALGAWRLVAESAIVRLRGDLSGKVLEYASGIVKLRLAAAEDRVFGQWSRTYAELEQRTATSKRIKVFNALLGTAVGTIANVAIFGTIVHGDLIQKGFGLGSLVAFLSAMSQAIGGLGQLSGVVLDLLGLRPVLKSAEPILKAAPEVRDDLVAPGALTGEIEISHVQFSYGPELPPVFTDLSLQVRAGEYVAIVGPSGAGKSSVIRLLLGFEAPQRGAILVDGKDLRGLDIQAVRRQMGIVLQHSRLFGTSMLDNILGANLHLTERDAWVAAERAGLDQDISAMPMGMQTILSDGTLSGGQMQRVMIARALVHEPRIVVFDEATSALDNRTQAIVTASLERMNATRIVIAHRLSSVVTADRIVVIDGGRVTESGSYADLMNRGGFFASLAARQLVEAEEPGTVPA